MRTIINILVIAALTLVGGRLEAQQDQGYVVVVNAANPATELSKDLVEKIFLKTAQKFDNGTAAVPVNNDPASKVRAAFTKAVLKRSVSAMDSYWQQQIFAGKDVPPQEKNSDAAVLDFVRATPGAIGYVAPGTALGAGVKAVTLK
jgi:ABC-type phosphate transport system substrate-binding protein